MTEALRQLQRFNQWLAILAGLLLLTSVSVTLFDVIARQFGRSLGGTDELSGYVMAIATSWGMSYTLTHLAHVRIDLLRTRCASLGRALFDAIAIICLATTTAVIAFRAWPVLAKSIQNNSTANTTLETPLWIPQSLWLAGWFWFAVSALFIAAHVIHALVHGKFERIEAAAGLPDAHPQPALLTQTHEQRAKPQQKGEDQS